MFERILDIMSCFGKINRCRNNFRGYYKNGNVFHKRTNELSFKQTQACDYTKKSAEEKLGIEKPKRPLNPFFKFMMQIRPALNSKIPGISSKEAVVWSSKHWQQLDNETKSQMKKDYKNALDIYKMNRIEFDSTLTEKQSDDIKKLNLETMANQEKRKLKAECKKMGMPKKPMSSYLLYTQSRKDVFPSTQLKVYQGKVKADWLKLPKSERDKFEKQAQDLMKKYKRDMEAWELKMISLGQSHLVQRVSGKKTKDKCIKSK